LTRCPPSGPSFTVTAQRCCSHLLIEKGFPHDRRTGDMFITHPHLVQGHAHPVSPRLDSSPEF
jgi:hypothetical protein